MNLVTIHKGCAMPQDTQYVVYDLEMVDATHVWNVAMNNLYRSTERFDAVVWPGLDPIPPPRTKDGPAR